jgi:hypothetical protein
MTLTCQPVRVATGFDEESMPVFDGRKRLVAVRTQCSALHDDIGNDDMGDDDMGDDDMGDDDIREDDMGRHWFLEAVFGRPTG